MKAIIARGHHADDYGSYGDFFHEPLDSAAAIIVPQYREYPDLIAAFIASGGGDPAAFTTSAAMQAELCSTSAAVMVLLLAGPRRGAGRLLDGRPDDRARRGDARCADQRALAYAGRHRRRPPGASPWPSASSRPENRWTA